MKSSLTRIFAGFALAAGVTCAAPVASAGVVLPSPDCPSNCLQFGDFSVYSLTLLNMQATGSASNPNPGDPFFVASNPGELTKNYVVFGTGTSNPGVVQNPAGMDWAFATPSGSPNAFFSTGAGPDPSQVAPFTGDQATTWDARVSALRSFLATSGGVFAPFFNLNETGNNNLPGIDLLIWMHAQLVDESGVLPTRDFYLRAAPGTGPDPAAPQVGTGIPFDPQWVYVHGTICADSATNLFLHFGPCTAGDPATARDLDQNLGANQAAFAIFNSDLDSLVRDPSSGYDLLHVDWRMTWEDNGYEQGFLAADTTFRVPEPGTAALAGLGLLAIGFALYRKRRSGLA